jgi:hypothetical protein
MKILGKKWVKTREIVAPCDYSSVRHGNGHNSNIYMPVSMSPTPRQRYRGPIPYIHGDMTLHPNDSFPIQHNEYSRNPYFHYDQIEETDHVLVPATKPTITKHTANNSPFSAQPNHYVEDQYVNDDIFDITNYTFAPTSTTARTSKNSPFPVKAKQCPSQHMDPSSLFSAQSNGHLEDQYGAGKIWITPPTRTNLSRIQRALQTVCSRHIQSSIRHHTLIHPNVPRAIGRIFRRPVDRRRYFQQDYCQP